MVKYWELKKLDYVECSCKSNTFTVRYNDDFTVLLECTDCGKEYVIGRKVDIL